jgi:hypothetical protein
VLHGERHAERPQVTCDELQLEAWQLILRIVPRGPLEAPNAASTCVAGRRKPSGLHRQWH